MEDIIVKQLKDIDEILLCKVNHTIIGQVPSKFVVSQGKNWDDIDTIKLNIPSEYLSPQTKTNVPYPLYDEFRNERYLVIDDEYFVIKEIRENKLTKYKEVTAYGQEKKLEKINFAVSNIGLSLLDNDIDNNIYAFNDELYKLTGWRLGHVDDSVRYSENGEYKVRIQEDTDTSFYSFITETLSELFCCVPIFDRKNKTINLYDEDSFGDSLKLVLTKDNYITSLIKTSNSSDVITRLKLKGNEEKCDIRDVTPTGYDYIENYSYFVQTKEMSDDLIQSIMLFEKLTPDRIEQWKEKTKEKTELQALLSTKLSNETIINSTITVLQSAIEQYDSLESETEEYALEDLKSQLLYKQEELVGLNIEIANYQSKIDTLTKEIDVLNKECCRETSTDLNGNPIFTQESLDELKEFVYYDTYSDDSFIDANELLKTGEKVLEKRCKPTFEFSVDAVNFTKRLVMNPTRRQWNGEIGLGDVIALYDKENDIEEWVYFVGWEETYKQGVSDSLTLTFSNKKTKLNNSKEISTLLKSVKNQTKLWNSSKSVINDSKYNRANYEIYTTNNLDFDFVIPEVVLKNPVDSIELNETTLRINLNESYSLSVSFTPENASNKNVTWITSDPTICTVNEGRITGLKDGKVTITCVSEDGFKKATCIVTVGDYYDVGNKDTNVTNIRLNQTSLEMNINGEYYLVATVIPLTASCKTVAFTSSNSKVATVNEDGLVVGVGAGTCRITCMSGENASIQASALVTVTNVVEDKKANLNNALIIGSDRVVNMESTGLLSKMTVKAKANVSASYFYSIDNDLISTMPNDPSMVIVMLGEHDPTAIGIDAMKTLLKKLVEKYKSKRIFVVQELPLGIAYSEVEGDYKVMNSQIKTFNDIVLSYSKGMGISTVSCTDELVANNLLMSAYTDDGINLNTSGARLLYDNMITKILGELNTDEIEVPDTPSDTDKDDSLGTTPEKDKTTKYECTANSALNIRSGPGTNYSVIGTASPGQTINVYSITDGWAKIKWTNNLTAYCSEKYIEKQSSTSESTDNTMSNARSKIVARAKEIAKMEDNGKAWYSQYNRTTNWNKKQVIKSSTETIYSQGVKKTYRQPGKGKYGFDCSSLVGVCYQAAGYTFMRGLSCAGGTLQSMAKKHNATAWRYVDDRNFKKAKPGDIVMWANDSTTLTRNNMFTVRTHHTAIYVGDGKVVEASGYTSGIPYRKGNWNSHAFFIRIGELTEADKKATTPIKDNSSSSTKDSTNCYNEKGTKDGNKYIYKFTKARCTCYGGNASKAASGTKMTYGKSCAAHNMPYGTKIYIPALKGKFGNSSGIYTVHDTGGYCFDFDLFLASSDSAAGKLMGSPMFTTVYVLSWGSGRTAASFTSMVETCNKYYGVGAFHSAWKEYMKYGGCTINFWKFNSTDKSMKSKSWYSKL